MDSFHRLWICSHPTTGSQSKSPVSVQTRYNYPVNLKIFIFRGNMNSIMVITGISLIIGLAAPPNHVRAYLDPGSGSILLQVLIAGLLASLLIIRSSWAKIKTFFNRLFSRDVDKPE